MNKQAQSEFIEQAARSAPAAAGAIATSVTLSEGVAIATLVYIVIQAIYLGWKFASERGERAAARQAASEAAEREARREAREERTVVAAEAREAARKARDNRAHERLERMHHSRPAPLDDDKGGGA